MKSIALVVAAAIGLAGVSPIHAQGTDKESLGTMLGGIAGGLLGNKLGKDGNRVLGTLAGAALGAFIGKKIGAALDEQDKQRLAEATVKAADTGTTQTVVSPSSGATMTTTATPAPSPAIASNAAIVPARECKTVKQSVVLRNGEKQEDSVKLCKSGNDWEVVDA